MDNIKEDLISQIYTYFPKDVGILDEAYWTTKEFLNLKEKCQLIADNTSLWNSLYDSLRELFPYYLIIDKTAYHDFDRCYSLIITFNNQVNNIKYFEVFVSYIVPYYLICLTETDGKGSYKYSIYPFDSSNTVNEKTLFDLNIINETILKMFPYKMITPSIGKTILNDIAFQNLDFGEMSIYKAVFTNYIFPKSKSIINP